MLPPSPTYGNPQNRERNLRVYQQLLQSNYLTDHIYDSSRHNSHQAAQIKFTTCSPSWPQPVHETHSPNPFKTFEGSRTSQQITQSLGSTYSITEIENQSYSTLNLYSLSHQQIDQDLSSNNITAQLVPDNQILPIEEEDGKPNAQQEQSTFQNSPRKQEVSCVQPEDLIKKYRSEEYSLQKEASSHAENDEEAEEGHVPRILADKYLKNDIKKFTESQMGQQDSFKTVVNEIHVVPYNIHHTVQTYAFSIPTHPNSKKMSTNTQSQAQHTRKANSLQLQHSRQSEESEEIPASTTTRPLYLSTHPHLQAKNHHFTYQTPSQSQVTKPQRNAPKSEPKYHTSSSDRNHRSNSIECKAKPQFLPSKPNETEHERLDQSRVTKIFHNTPLIADNGGLQPTNSVIYESNAVNLCCGQNQIEKTNINRINFLPAPKKEEDASRGTSAFFDPMNSFDITNIAAMQRPKLPNYKINPIHTIKNLSQQGEQSPKKGLRLVGFNPSFPNRKND